MWLFAIKLGDIYLYRGVNKSEFESMLEQLKSIKDALTIYKPNYDDYKYK